MNKLYAGMLISLMPVTVNAEVVNFSHFKIDTETRTVSPLLMQGEIADKGSLYLAKISTTATREALNNSVELIQMVAPATYLVKGSFTAIHGDAFEWAVKYQPEMKLAKQLQKDLSRKVIINSGPRSRYRVLMSDSRKAAKEQLQQLLLEQDIKADINIQSTRSNIILELNTAELISLLSSDLVTHVSEPAEEEVEESISVDSVISRSAHGTDILSSFDESCNSIGHYTGQGVSIAVWDSGFRESQSAFQNDDGSDNFVLQRTQTIARSAYEGQTITDDQENLKHGTVVFSVIGSNGMSTTATDMTRCTTGVVPEANFVLGQWHQLGSLSTSESWSQGETALSDGIAELAGSRRTPIQVGSKNYTTYNYEYEDEVVDGKDVRTYGDAKASANRYNSLAREIDGTVLANDILMITPTSNRGGSDPDNGRKVFKAAYSKNGVAVGSIHFNRSTNKANHSWKTGGSGSSVKMATSDNRVKPDLVAEHCYNTATATTDTSVSSSTRAICGVSVAAPYVAGQFGILYQMWAEGAIHGDDDGEGGSLMAGEIAESFAHRPTTSMAKAIMVNTAERYPLTQFEQGIQGWGVANVENIVMAQNSVRSNVSEYTFAKALPLVHEGAFGGLGRSLPFGERYDHSNSTVNHASQGAYFIDVKAGTKELNITLAWVDLPAISGTVDALMLDFNLYAYRYEDGIATHHYLGNNFDNDYHTQLGTSGISRDNKNNIESIFVKNPVPGLYKLSIDPQAIGIDAKSVSLVATCDGGTCAEVIHASTYNPYVKVSGERPWRYMSSNLNTPSKNTGPSTGPKNTIDGTGNAPYFYFEATNYSGMGSDFKATYNDAIIEFHEGYINPREWILDFDMHKWGVNQGTLYVEYYYPDSDTWKPIWHNASSTNKDEWQNVSLSLNGWAGHHRDNSKNGKTKFRIRYDHWDGWSGDIAIANITLKPNYNYIN